MARARLFNVPRDERRQAGARRALCLDIESQFRRPPGQRRTYPPRKSCNGGRCRDCRTFRRRASTCLNKGVNDMIKKLAALAAIAGMVIGVSACNTVEGAGKDVKAAGTGIEKAADKAKPY